MKEAALATTAAPTFFPPFVHRSTGKEYWDGGLFYNNPAQIAREECGRIWPDTKGEDPELLLSVGCGFSLKKDDEDAGLWALFKRVFGLVNHISVLCRRLREELNTERIWDDRFGELSGKHPERYIRLNPKFTGALPQLDDIKSLSHGNLEKEAARFLNSQEAKAKVNLIARRLMATSFYFEPSSEPELHKNRDVDFVGRIRCRFVDGSSELRAFADVIREFYPQGQIFFELMTPRNYSWQLSSEHLRDMESIGKFSINISFTVPAAVTHVDLRLFSTAERKPPERIGGSPFMVRRSDDGHS